MKELDEEIRAFLYDRKHSAIFIDGMVPIIKDFYLKKINSELGLLFEKIKHGGEDHQKWLHDTMKEHYERQVKNEKPEILL